MPHKSNKKEGSKGKDSKGDVKKNLNKSTQSKLVTKNGAKDGPSKKKNKKARSAEEERYYNKDKENEERGLGTVLKELYRSVLFALGIFWRLSPGYLVLFLITDVLKRLQSVFFAYIGAITIDEAIRIISEESGDLFDIVPFLVIMLIYEIFMSGVGYINRFTRRSLRAVSRGNFELLLAENYERIGLINLEDPKIADKVERTRDWIWMTYDLMVQSIQFLGSVIAMLITGFSIFIFNPLVALFIVLAAIVQFIPKRHFIKRDFALWFDTTQERRKAWSNFYTLSRSEELVEVLVTGGGEFFKKRFRGFWEFFRGKQVNLFKREATTLFLAELLEHFVIVLGYAMAFRDAILGRITIGEVTFYIGVLNTFNRSINQIFESMSLLLDMSNKISEVVDLFAVESPKDGEVVLPRLVEPPAISIKGLSFKYPNSTNYVFKDLDLEVKSGEKVAIVGHNGAGKTTLVKLLGRLYEYQKGEIRVNGELIQDLRLNDWYKNIGILFQEYNFYSQLTARENIHAGVPLKKYDENKAIKAAKAADAHDFISKLEHGYEEVMSEKYENGTRPSTGQKQKIAIARFLYRDAPLAVFDEPTAAIDAISEYKIFNEIYEFFSNKTVIIISHRFSTVRNADRIIVLEDGKIIEQGSHDQLMKKDGQYAKAFKLQAEGYQ